MGMGKVIGKFLLKHVVMPMAGKAIRGLISKDENKAQVPDSSIESRALEAAMGQEDERDYREEAQSVIKDAQADLLGTHNIEEPIELSDSRLKTQHNMTTDEIQRFMKYINEKRILQGGSPSQHIEYKEDGIEGLTDDALAEDVAAFRDKVFVGDNPKVDPTPTRPKRDVSSQNRNPRGQFSKQNPVTALVPYVGPKSPDPDNSIDLESIGSDNTVDLDPADTSVTIGKGDDLGADTVVKEDKPKDPTDIDVDINPAMRRALIGKILGNAVGSILSFDAGGVKGETFASPMQSVGTLVNNAANLTYSEKKGAIARDAEAKLMLELRNEIDKIESNPALSIPQQTYYIDKAKSRMHDRIRRMQHTMRLDAPVAQGEVKMTSSKEVKNIKPCARTALQLMRAGIELSSADYKVFSDIDPEEMAIAINEAGPPYRGHELEFLHDFTAGREGGEYIKPIQYAGIWSPEVLQGYAMWIKNAHYNYKPEAQALDPDIDPNTEHIGPMAEEIEKVIPAAVQEVEGVKTVDTGRLALANAGAIADLARQNIMQGKAIEQLAELVKGVA